MGDSSPRYNLRSPSVKRLMQEAKELNQATEQYHAQPLEDNLYEWHFTIRGTPETEFASGVYHGRIMLPTEYPMKPPSIVLLTPNGRFEVNKKICLSISGHHPESWQPSWSIRTALMAIIGFLPTPGKGAIGALDYPPEERKKLARKSRDWKCHTCETENHKLLVEPREKTPGAKGDGDEEAEKLLKEVKDLAAQISFKGEGSPAPSPPHDASKTFEQYAAGDSATNPATTATTDPPQPQQNLRHRGVRSEGNTQPRNTPPAQRRNRIDNSSSFYLMVLVSVTIGVLLLRRLFHHFDSIADFM